MSLFMSVEKTKKKTTKENLQSIKKKKNKKLIIISVLSGSENNVLALRVFVFRFLPTTFRVNNSPRL